MIIFYNDKINELLCNKLRVKRDSHAKKYNKEINVENMTERPIFVYFLKRTYFFSTKEK